MTIQSGDQLLIGDDIFFVQITKDHQVAFHHINNPDKSFHAIHTTPTTDKDGITLSFFPLPKFSRS